LVVARLAFGGVEPAKEDARDDDPATTLRQA
jgi:hypothetical protein